MVELRGGLVVLVRPGLRAIEGDGRATVIREDHPLRVRRVDPERVRVAVLDVDLLEGAPSIDGLEHRQVHHVHDILVFGIGRDAGVVPVAHPHARIVVHPLPTRAGVFGAKEPARGVRGFDRGIEPLRVRARDIDADLAERAARDPGSL